MNIVKSKHFTEWMNEGFIGEYNKVSPGNSYQMTKRLLLANGQSLSIQAGYTHYCSPRRNSETGDYSEYQEFEIGFPKEPMTELFTEYAEDVEHLTDTVYCYVPAELIHEYIEACGGVVGFDKH